MRSTLIFTLLVVLAGCCPPPRPAAAEKFPIASQPISTTFDPAHVPGPTRMAKGAGGYELTNTLYRAVISEQTGDVVFWGYHEPGRNMVFQRGIYTGLTALPDAPMHGYIEKRDEQTWQFYGEDDNHIIWRKIYSLEGDSLFVSVIILNNRPDVLSTAIQINGDLISLKLEHHDPELFIGHGGYGQVRIQGWNEFPAPSSQPALPTLVQSDTFHLQPQQRQGYTSQWKLLP